VDSEVLAHLLRSDLIAQAYAPSLQDQGYKEPPEIQNVSGKNQDLP